jgi:peptidoglycan/xylan/chitin deacetylase (PgdA/CDA1 family)
MRKTARFLPLALILAIGVILFAIVACAICRWTAPAILPPSPVPTLAPTLEPSSVFSSTRLSQPPQAYIVDVCQYLRDRWDPVKSAPGTVVVPIMFHSVQEGSEYQAGDTFIPLQELTRTVQAAQRLGFETITAAQLAGFLEHNALIPRRSMIWIVDDRRPGDMEDHILPIVRENGWTVSLGWVIGDTDQRKGLWERMEAMNATGHLDVQSHGYHHRYIVSDTPEEVVRQELSDPMPILERHFGQKPVAFVWPGGNFTAAAVAVARQAGYRIGFTAFSRGPFMYNWIPLGEPEREAGDPLMVLPRFWAKPGLAEHLEVAADLGEAAAALAAESYSREAAYYRAHCEGALPASPRRE